MLICRYLQRILHGFYAGHCAADFKAEAGAKSNGGLAVQAISVSLSAAGAANVWIFVP